jgi:hypothetical protein
MVKFTGCKPNFRRWIGNRVQILSAGIKKAKSRNALIGHDHELINITTGKAA